MEFIRGIDLESHKVIEMWERINFADKEAFRIVNESGSSSCYEEPYSPEDYLGVRMSEYDDR